MTEYTYKIQAPSWLDGFEEKTVDDHIADFEERFEQLQLTEMEAKLYAVVSIQQKQIEALLLAMRMNGLEHLPGYDY